MTRRERLENKLAKRAEWAQKADARADARLARAHDAVSGIEFGQPILIGHHSEKRHRAALKRQEQNMDKFCAEMDLKRHHEQKADGLAAQLDRAIFSDDPDAIEALRAKADAIEAECERMKRANAIFRKMKGAPGWAAAAGFENPDAIEAAWAKLKAICPYERQPFPAYSLANKRSTARTARARVEDIERRQRLTAAAAAAPNGVLILGTDHVTVTFPEKPSREIITALKAAGFHWGAGSWRGYRKDLPAILTETPTHE